ITMKREKNLLAAVELAINTLKEDLTPKKRQDTIRLLRQAIHSWKKKRESDQDEFGILSILSIHRSALPESLVKKLFDPNQIPELYEYTDNLNNSEEHLFSISLINETAEYNLV